MCQLGIYYIPSVINPLESQPVFVCACVCVCVCVCVDRHLAVVGHIFQREKEREKYRAILSLDR